jgi:hypothetical protein
LHAATLHSARCAPVLDGRDGLAYICAANLSRARKPRRIDSLSLNAAANTDVAISGLAVSDVDDATSLTRTLHVEHSTLNVATVVGRGSSTVTLTGNVAEIDAALGAANNVLYHSAFDFNGIDHLTMTSDDGSLSDIDVLDIQVAPAIAACTFNGITRPALNLDSTGHIILDQPAADFAAAYGTKAL